MRASDTRRHCKVSGSGVCVTWEEGSTAFCCLKWKMIICSKSHGHPV